MQLNGILPSRVVLSYVFDYCIIIFLIIAFSALDKAEPHHQRFSIHNASLQYPFADPERIAPWLAALVSCAFPILVIILYTMVIDGMFSHHKNAAGHRGYPHRGIYTLHERLWEMNAGILGLGLSVAGTITITGALKNLTGKPRPDVLARCVPKDGWIEPPIGLSGYEICTGDPYILRDGFKSWPSGHSSIAFAGLGYLSIYLSGKLHILDSRGEVWKTFLVLIPMLAASMVAISRIMDARHHPFDVISSSILGMFLAWVSYRQYFPSLHQTWKKGRAFPIRSWGRDPPPPVDDNNGFLRSADEEEGGKGFKGNRALPSSLPEDENLAAQRRRQYLEDQEMLERRRRRTHDFYDEYTETNQSQLASPPQNTAYQPTPSHDPDNEEVGSIEMRERKVAKTVEPKYQAYLGGQPNRQYTQSTNDSNEPEDHKRAIAAATNAVDPIPQTGYMRGSDDGFVQVKTGPRGVDS